MAISEAEYDARALTELHRLVDALDALGDESVEAELAADILTIEFSDGTKYVLNSHRAARQIWMAAERSAWHFDWNPGNAEWVAAKNGDELWSVVERSLTARLGRQVSLSRS